MAFQFSHLIHIDMHNFFQGASQLHLGLCILLNSILSIYSAHDMTCDKLLKAIWDIQLLVRCFEGKRFVQV